MVLCQGSEGHSSGCGRPVSGPEKHRASGMLGGPAWLLSTSPGAPDLEEPRTLTFDSAGLPSGLR